MGVISTSKVITSSAKNVLNTRLPNLDSVSKGGHCFKSSSALSSIADLLGAS